MWNTQYKCSKKRHHWDQRGERFRYDMVRYVKNIVDPERRTAELDF